jgi:hypothetical protein
MHYAPSVLRTLFLPISVDRLGSKTVPWSPPLLKDGRLGLNRPLVLLLIR